MMRRCARSACSRVSAEGRRWGVMSNWPRRLGNSAGVAGRSRRFRAGQLLQLVSQPAQGRSRVVMGGLRSPFPDLGPPGSELLRRCDGRLA